MLQLLAMSLSAMSFAWFAMWAILIAMVLAGLAVATLSILSWLARQDQDQNWRPKYK